MASLLANLSPAYSAIKGEGVFGDVFGKKSQKEKAMQAVQEQKAAQEQAAAKANAQQWANSRTGMKKGGSVSASSRADGCCTKGKTRGKMY